MLLAAGFRPFFLLAAFWAAIAVPLWLARIGAFALFALFYGPLLLGIKR